MKISVQAIGLTPHEPLESHVDKKSKQTRHVL